uniref:Crossover junction endodeoxyribonuclease RuvC n=1 Tax=candidate division WOR-3 bacterium TaxID=2052148 RepID=A0A7C4TCJ5_UNCW3
MKIIGIDPGISATGYGILADNDRITRGTIRPRDKDYIKRIKTICEKIQSLLRHHKPDFVALEKAFYQKNVSSLIRISELRGAILYVLQQSRVKILEYTPAQIKLTTTGNGRASKKQVRFIIERILLKDESRDSHHAIDALAIAYTARRKIR